MVVRVDSGEKFYCGKNWAEQPACRTNMGAVKWSIAIPALPLSLFCSRGSRSLSSSSIAAPLLHRCIVNLHRNLHKCIPSQACKRNDFLWRAVSNQRLTMVQTKNHVVNQETNPTNATIIPPKSSSSYSSSVSHRLRHRRYPYYYAPSPTSLRRYPPLLNINLSGHRIANNKY